MSLTRLISTKLQKSVLLQAINQLKGEVTKPDYLLIDAMHLETSIPQQSLLKGDANSLSIAAASIVAKVTRDRMMLTMPMIILGMPLKKTLAMEPKST